LRTSAAKEVELPKYRNRVYTDVNRSAILAQLGAYGPASRAVLARKLEVTPPLVTQLVKQLILDGLVQELHLSPSSGGRPSRMLGLVSTAGHAIGVKIAPEQVTLVEVSIDGVVIRSQNSAFDSASHMALSSLVELLRNFIAGGTTHLLGIGVGVPGEIDEQSVGIVNSTQLGWSRVPLGSTMRNALNLPVLVDNNVNALSVAERLFGQGRFFKDFLVVTIGTGIGAGIVADGKVFRGHEGGAGDLGHITIDTNGPLCQCGNRGCLEAYIGEKALTKIAKEEGVLKEDGDMTTLTELANRGDESARAIFKHAGQLLGRVIAGAVNILDPEIVIILGEGTESWRYWSTGFGPALRSALTPSKREVAIGIETWRDESWARGAACLVLAIPLDETAGAGDQGELVRARLRIAANSRNSN